MTSTMGMHNVTIYLRKLRQSRKISQVKLADAMGLSPRQASRWETGESGINPDALLRAVIFLGASFEHIEQLLIHEEVTNDDIDDMVSGLMKKQMTERNEVYKTLSLKEQISEAQRRVEWLHAKSPALAQQFLDYGRFLEEYT